MKDFTLAPKKVVDEHFKAVNHFAKNLAADYNNYKPMKGYRHKKFKNYQPHEVPKVGTTMSYKGEFVTVLAKDKAHFVASGVKVVISQINSSGVKKKFFETKTDDGGRLLKEFKLSNEDCACEYEMICKTADYFSEKSVVC